MAINCKIKKEWLNAESEHTTNYFKAKKIVMEHIKEHGCGYYPALLKMERRLKK